MTLVLVALGAAGAAAAVPTDGTQAQTAGTVQAEGPSVTLNNQTSGGTTVTVASVTVPDGGFVTIHTAAVTEGGAKTFSSVSGTSGYLSAGTHENVTVTLDEPVDNTSTLVAMPHKDTNGDHTYSFVASNGEADGPYTSMGNIVIDTATVTVSASVTYDQSRTNGSSITVERVELSENGFLAIHDSSLLDGDTFASVRGVSGQLSAGVHEDVSFRLDEPLESNDTLIAMPHKDTDDDGEYDFVTSDGADDGVFTDAGGNIVLMPSPVAVTGDNAASVTMANQSSGGHLVYVEEVYLPSGGFVTAHDSSLLDGDTFASVRGTSAYLTAGNHEHVPITLDEPLNESDTVIAMPHKDTDDDRAYDFVTSEGQDDGPYTDGNGNIVLDPGQVTVSAGVHVHGQGSAGNSVTVATADLSQDGFVTIHDASLTAGATFDSVRGSTYLEAGLHEGVTVPLDDPLVTSQTVYAMPHKDTDGDAEYDFVTSGGSTDAPFTANGNIVFEGASVSVLSQVTFTNQSVDGNTVTVDSVTLQDGGFVTIHGPSLADGEALASVLGTSEYLGPGTHENVTVTLDSVPTTDGAMFAMPHYDTNDNQQYDFVTSEGAADGPYTAGGNIVFEPATVTVPGQASVTLESQATAGSSLTVQSVSVSKGGFVTIHDASLLDGDTFESVRGTSAYLEAGEHSDVEVTLDEPVEESGTFIAMPHLDTNGNEEYDFVSSEGTDDGPYTTSGGDIVLDDAEVTLSMASETDDGQMAEGSPTGTSQPGFGLVVAMLALVAAALLALRRD